MAWYDNCQLLYEPEYKELYRRNKQKLSPEMFKTPSVCAGANMKGTIDMDKIKSFWTNERRSEAVRLSDSGLTDKQIAEQFKAQYIDTPADLNNRCVSGYIKAERRKATIQAKIRASKAIYSKPIAAETVRTEPSEPSEPSGTEPTELIRSEAVNETNEVTPEPITTETLPTNAPNYTEQSEQGDAFNPSEWATTIEPTKPTVSTLPIGLKSRRQHDAERTDEIVSAMVRYAEARCLIPSEWIEEYNELVGRYKSN